MKVQIDIAFGQLLNIAKTLPAGQLDQLKKNNIRISPFVKSLSSGINISTDLDYKKEYADHLTEKYK